jgi:hypothetical protein
MTPFAGTDYEIMFQVMGLTWKKLTMPGGGVIPLRTLSQYQSRFGTL